MTTAPTDLQLVSMARVHVPAVVEIEERVYPQPWSAELFLAEISEPLTRDYTVASTGGRVVGYTGLWFVDNEAHVTTIAVDPTYQNRRLATRLMLRNVDLCTLRSVNSMTLEVRTSNEPALALYRAFGFAPAGVRRGYYSDPKEDALIMWAHDVDSVAYAERMQVVESRLAS